MMKKILIIFLLPIASYYSCKSKPKNNFVSIVSYIQSQVRDVDTSLYSIIKAEKNGSDSLWDTTYVKREQFRSLAKDFLNIPDIASSSFGKKYKEETMYDDQLQRAIITYTPTDDNEEILKEQLVIAQGDTAFNKMKSVIIERVKDSGDSTIRQHLLWQTNEKFQVVTIIEKKGEPVSTKTIEVTWNPENIIQNNLPEKPDTTRAAIKSRHRVDSLIRIRNESNK